MNYVLLGLAVTLSLALVTIWSRRYFHDHNRDLEKWKQLRERLSESDLEDLEYCTYQAREVPMELMDRLRLLADDFAEGREDIRFSQRKERRLRRPKQTFADAYRAYRDFVQVPYWDVYEEGWRLQKQWMVDQGIDYAKHLTLACEEIDVMRSAYREMHEAVDRW
ncbi:MAG: hypothetical protein AAF436_05050 [Myxococcota bacterium]